MTEFNYDIGILGGGLASLSLAYFLENKSVAILEKKDKVGGLCASYKKNGIVYDVGPHIIFSKNKVVLDFLNNISENNLYTRSNKIYLNGKFIKYPFENFLSQIKDQNVIRYCLDSFINNPYKNLPANNMLSYFLKTFGEGITRTYLQPYNEKIWKFDPVMMNTRMLDKVPEPPRQDIINSARGKFSEGHLRQLYFSYPKNGGIETIVKGLKNHIISNGTEIFCRQQIKSVDSIHGLWVVKTADSTYRFKKIVNCMPIHELVSVLSKVPLNVVSGVKNLIYNSIITVLINVKRDYIGNNFMIMVPQKDVIFHRVSKLNFMGGNYHKVDSSSLLIEITFRQGDQISKMSKADIINRCIADLVKIKFIKSKSSVNFTDIKKQKYAYVVHDLNHEQNRGLVLKFLESMGVSSCGRFAEFEYLSADQVIERSMALATKLSKNF